MRSTRIVFAYTKRFPKICHKCHVPEKKFNRESNENHVLVEKFEKVGFTISFKTSHITLLVFLGDTTPLFFLL